MLKKMRETGVIIGLVFAIAVAGNIVDRMVGGNGRWWDAVEVEAGLATRTAYVANTEILASHANANESNMINVINGMIEDVNMRCVSGNDWDLITDCNGVDIADTMHKHTIAGLTITASDIAITDTGGYYSTDTVEDALQEVHTQIAYSSLIDYAYATTEYNADASTSLSVTVAAGIASNGIIINLSGFFQTLNGRRIFVTPTVNGVPKSTDAARDYYWELLLSESAGGTSGHFGTQIIFDPALGWDNSTATVIGADVYVTGGAGGNVSDIVMAVHGIP